MVLLNSSGEVELSFDAGSAKVANVGSKCLMVTETTIGDNNKKTYKTVVKKLDAVKNWSIKVNEESTETIPLGTEIFDIVNTLKSVGITSSTSDTSVSEEAQAIYQKEDSNEPNYINITVNLGGDDNIALKFNRSAGVITLNDVIEALNANADFIAYANANKPTEEVSGAYKLVANRKKVISPSSKILTDLEIFCTWKEKEISNPDTETDEFTYVKTPGKISKLFVHIGRPYKEFNSYENIDRVNYFSDLGLHDYLAYKFMDESSTGSHLIIKQDEAIEFIESKLHQLDGSHFIIKDADGVLRYDLSSNDYVSDMMNTSGIRSMAAQIVEDYTDNGTAIDNIKFVVKEHIVKSIVVNTNLTMNSTLDDIVSCIKGSKDFVDEFKNNWVALRTSDGSDCVVRNINSIDDIDIDTNNGDNNNDIGIYVMSSDFISAYESYNANDTIVRNEYSGHRRSYSNMTFNEMWETETNFDPQDASENWKGINIVKKAIDEGRALDIYVKTDRNDWNHRLDLKSNQN